MSVHVPPHFAVPDQAAIARMVHEQPFATLITPADPEPWITHLPLIFAAPDESSGVLLGHFARANAHRQHVEGRSSIAIFHGPHAYVSPAWYREPAVSVPTWNYAVAHVLGAIELCRDASANRVIVDALVERFEGSRPAPWQIGPDRSRQDAMLEAIVGFRLRIERIDAKFKLSQNRSGDDRTRVVDALASEGYADATALAAWMRRYAIATPDGQG